MGITTDKESSVLSHHASHPVNLGSTTNDIPNVVPGISPVQVGSVISFASPSYFLMNCRAIFALLIIVLSATAGVTTASANAGQAWITLSHHADTHEEREALEAIETLIKPTWESSQEQTDRAWEQVKAHVEQPWMGEALLAAYQKESGYWRTHDLILFALQQRSDLRELYPLIPEVMVKCDEQCQLGLFEFVENHPEAKPADWLDVLIEVATTHRPGLTDRIDNPRARSQSIHHLLQIDETLWDKEGVYKLLLKEFSQYSIVPRFAAPDGNESVTEAALALLTSFYGFTLELLKSTISRCSYNCEGAPQWLVERYPVSQEAYDVLRTETLKKLARGNREQLDKNLGSLYEALILLSADDTFQPEPMAYDMVSVRPSDYIPLADQAYFMWAAAQHDRLGQVSIQELIKQILSVGKYDKPGYSGSFRSEIINVLAKTQFRLSGNADVALNELFPEKELATAPQWLKKSLLKSVIAAIGKDPSANERIILETGRLTNWDPALVLTVLEWVRNNLYGMQDVMWSSQAHEVLKMLSEETELGNYPSHGIGFTVRESAWLLRMGVLGETMPREVALTLEYWKTEAMISVYNDRYLYAWLSLIPLAILLLLFSQHRVFYGLVALLYPVALIAPIWVLAVIFSIGHNSANMRGYLAVWQNGFYFFLLSVVIAWGIGLCHLWRHKKR